jgi:predicted nucleic acid-binding protein
MTAIDTNILIYSLDRHDPVKLAKARALLRQLRSQPDKVVVPWQVLGEFLRFLRSLPIFAEAQFAFFALIFLGGQAGFSTVSTASALSGTSPHKQARRSS